MNDEPRSAPIIFYSYSNDDEDHLLALVNHLSLLRSEGKISELYSKKIMPGDDWDESISRQLDLARIFLLLVSPSFMASKYIWDKELKRALERQKSGESLIVPVILKSCDWRTSPFGRFQALPTNGRPVTHWRNHNDAWTDVAEGIRALVDRL
jgi:hypothetical protein